MSDLDRYTLPELYELQGTLFGEHTRAYQATATRPVGAPGYRIARAAMDEVSELLITIYAEIKRREQETANAS